MVHGGLSESQVIVGGMGATPSGGMVPQGSYLGKISKRHPQSDYFGLGMSIQLRRKYPQRTVPGVGTMMGPIEEALRETFSLALFSVDEINSEFW